MNSLDDLLSEIHSIIKREFVDGLSIALIQDGTIYSHQGYGYQNKKKKIKVNERTIFQAASLSKALTAWGVLHLCERKGINLDDPIMNYLSRWKFHPSEYLAEEVTIRRILYHVAGLSVMSYYGYKKDDIPSLENSLSGTYNKRYRLEIIVKPGEQFIYSGGGFTLLQLFIEELSQQSFAEYMREHILHPLHMYDSYFDREEINDEHQIAKPYSPFGRELPHYFFAEKAAAGLYTTASDLGKFLCAHMYDSGVLGDGYRKLVCQRIDRRVKCGCGNYILSDNGTKIVLQRGQNRGWFSSFDMIPSKKSAIVILTNSNNGQNAIITLLEKWYEIQLQKNKIEATHFLLGRNSRNKIAFFDGLVQLGIFEYQRDALNLTIND